MNAHKKAGLWRLTMFSILLATTEAQAQVNYEPAARAFVEEMAAGRFDAAMARLDETMTRVMPLAKLTETWQAVTGQVGEYREVLSARQVEVQGYQAVLLTTKFEKTNLIVRVVFDTQGRISGLFFAPAQPPAPWAPPEYAQSNSFTERSVTVGQSPWELPGTLTLPKGSGKFPAVVLVQGSGSHDADETIGPNKPFKDLAWGLASRSVAVLRYEKRGHKYPKELAALPNVTVREEAVEDAQRAVDLLAQQPEIDPSRIFIVGHSLGAMLAPRIAAGKKNIAGLVLLAGNSRPLEVLIAEQVKYLAEADGQVTDAEKAQIEATDAAVCQITSPELKPSDTVKLFGASIPGSYFLDLRGYAPAQEVANLGLPLLILWGERDYQVRAADFEGWKKALANHKSAKRKSYPALNHLFIAGTGMSTPAEYAKAGHVAAEVIEDIAAWALEKKN